MTMLTRAALLWMDEHRRRAAMRRLLDHDDRMLADMGLVRAEMTAALALPLTENAREAAARASRAALGLDRWRRRSERDAPARRAAPSARSEEGGLADGAAMRPPGRCARAVLRSSLGRSVWRADAGGASRDGAVGRGTPGDAGR